MNSPVAVRRADSVKGGDGIEQMAVGQDWVCFDVAKEYEGEEGEVIWPHRQKKNSMEKRLMQGKTGCKRRRGISATTI